MSKKGKGKSSGSIKPKVEMISEFTTVIYYDEQPADEKGNIIKIPAEIVVDLTDEKEFLNGLNQMLNVLENCRLNDRVIKFHVLSNLQKNNPSKIIANIFHEMF